MLVSLAGHCIFQRLRPLGFKFGMRERFARKHLIERGGAVNEGGFDQRGLGDVFGLQAFIGALFER